METKICCKCEDEKDVSEFHKKGDGYQAMCKECRKPYIRQHYLNNKESYLEKARRHTLSIIKWLRELKLTLSCEKCGEDHPSCLEFHHINPDEKLFEISKAAGRSKKQILAELKKCKVLCANCHRKEHYNV